MTLSLPRLCLFKAFQVGLDGNDVSYVVFNVLLLGVSLSSLVDTNKKHFSV